MQILAARGTHNEGDRHECRDATVRVYDPYYSDYHAWNSAEAGYYRQRTVETRRPYREFRELPPPEQREYWGRGGITQRRRGNLLR